jgi:hypothetical protein
MALIDTVLPIAYAARAIAGQLGFRPHSVAVVTKEYSGDHVGDGLFAATETPITEDDGQPPKVRWLNDEQLAMANLVGASVIEIGPITPEHPGGGTSLALITGSDLPNGATLHYKVTGPRHPQGALYERVEVRSEKALRYMIRAKAVSAST